MSDAAITIFGIDLGTTYSCIAHVDETGKPRVAPNAEGELTTPSVVLFETATNRAIGRVAKNSAKLYPNAVVEMVKRQMGDPTWRFDYEGVEYRAEEISSYILRKVVDDATTFLGLDNPIKDVVITCPAYFGIAEREATARAGEIAGLTVHEVINEPTAAAISFGIQEQQDQVVLVYDLGGGTFDVTMIEIKGGAITVIATDGDKDLGGRDWDEAVVVYLAEEWKRATGSSDDLTASPETLQDLWQRAEDAKKALKALHETKVVVSHAGLSAGILLSREKFDELTADKLEKTIMFTRRVLESASKRGYSRFDQLLLVGGSTKMLQVPARLTREFGIEPKSYEPDLAVAKGAAIYGYNLALGRKIQIEVAKLTGGNADDVDLSQVAASVKERAEEAVARDNNLRLDVVRQSTRTKVTNVVSHSFGIVVTDASSRRELIANLVRKNDKLPVELTKRFGTLADGQTSVEIRVMENEYERDEVQEIHTATELGTAMIEDLPRGLPAGTPIDVTFELNQQGRLRVFGLEPSSRKQVEAIIQTSEGMSEEDVQAAVARTKGLTIY